jgi:hypothetical protein
LKFVQQNAPVKLTGAFLAKFYCVKDGTGKLGRLLQSADAGGTKALGNSLASFHHLHFLDVDIPTSAGRLTGPGTIVTELRAAATTLTLRHDDAPLTY